MAVVGLSTLHLFVLIAGMVSAQGGNLGISFARAVDRSYWLTGAALCLAEGDYASDNASRSAVRLLVWRPTGRDPALAHDFALQARSESFWLGSGCHHVALTRPLPMAAGDVVGWHLFGSGQLGAAGRQERGGMAALFRPCVDETAASCLSPGPIFRSARDDAAATVLPALWPDLADIVPIDTDAEARRSTLCTPLVTRTVERAEDEDDTVTVITVGDTLRFQLCVLALSILPSVLHWIPLRVACDNCRAEAYKFAAVQAGLRRLLEEELVRGGRVGFILVVDGYDVLLQARLGLLVRSFAAITGSASATSSRDAVVCAGEATCWPNGPWCRMWRRRLRRPPGANLDPYPYPNSGALLGRVEPMLKLLAELALTEQRLGDDQAALFTVALERPGSVLVDSDARLFLTLHGAAPLALERPLWQALEPEHWQPLRACNTGEAPPVLHFNGPAKEFLVPTVAALTSSGHFPVLDEGSCVVSIFGSPGAVGASNSGSMLKWSQHNLSFPLVRCNRRPLRRLRGSLFPAGVDTSWFLLSGDCRLNSVEWRDATPDINTEHARGSEARG